MHSALWPVSPVSGQCKACSRPWPRVAYCHCLRCTEKYLCLGCWYEHQGACSGPDPQQAVKRCKCADADEPKRSDDPNFGSDTKVHSAWTCRCPLLVHPWRTFAAEGTQLRISRDDGGITDIKIKAMGREVPDALPQDGCHLFFDETQGTFDGSVSRVHRCIREGTKVANELAALTGKGKTADLIMVCPDSLEYVTEQMEKEACILKDIRLARTKRAARDTGKGSLPEDP